jgi:glycosyltransferase involved in cell wall biosynthesis
LFDTILPINDGSDDDSVLQIQNFIEKHGYENFQILGDNTNKWKWIRYSETLEFCREKWIEVLVTTDADMINPWDTLPGILEALKRHPHVVSPVFESASPSTFQIAKSLSSLEWNKMNKSRWSVWKKSGYKKSLLPVYLQAWRYTLEPVCNWVFCGETHVLNYRDDEYRTAPVFLPEFRGELSAKEEQNAGYELVQGVFWEKVYKDFFK